MTKRSKWKTTRMAKRYRYRYHACSPECLVQPPETLKLNTLKVTTKCSWHFELRFRVNYIIGGYVFELELTASCRSLSNVALYRSGTDLFSSLIEYRGELFYTSIASTVSCKVIPTLNKGVFIFSISFSILLQSVGLRSQARNARWDHPEGEFVELDIKSPNPQPGS